MLTYGCKVALCAGENADLPRFSDNLSLRGGGERPYTVHARPEGGLKCQVWIPTTPFSCCPTAARSPGGRPALHAQRHRRPRRARLAPAGGLRPLPALRRCLPDQRVQRRAARTPSRPACRARLDVADRRRQPQLAPLRRQALRELADGGARRVLALPTAAFGSYSGCRQYREDLAGPSPCSPTARTVHRGGIEADAAAGSAGPATP